jgi:hypothetical protein
LAEETRALGDNQPLDPLTDLKNRLSDATATIEGRIRMIFVALEKMPAEITVDNESQVVDQIAQAKIELGKLEELRKETKRPVDDQVAEIQAHFKRISELLSEPKGAKGGILERMLLRLGAYQKAKADREKAERAAAQRKADAESARLREQAEAEQERASALARSAQTTEEREAAADAAQRAQETRAASDSAVKVAEAAARPVRTGHAVGTRAK